MTAIIAFLLLNNLQIPYEALFLSIVADTIVCCASPTIIWLSIAALTFLAVYFNTLIL